MHLNRHFASFCIGREIAIFVFVKVGKDRLSSNFERFGKKLLKSLFFII